MTVRETKRWTGVSAVALLAGGVGVVAGSPVTLLVGVVGVAFAAYARSGTPPSTAVSVSRSVDDADPAPGDEVRVEVTVTNDGDATLPDLRVVDGVPEGLRVTDGSARLGTALRPGKEAAFAYTVEAVRGEHRFDPATVVARDFSGAVEREFDVKNDTTLACTPELSATAEEVPLREQTTRHTGRVTTGEGGAGVEFYATREYRPGDPMSRIDWNRRAKTGELTTVQFRQERVATVVLLVDAREQAYVAASPDEPSAVEHSVRAAGKTFAALLDSGDRVGVATLAPENGWLAPGAGNQHRAQAREFLAHHESLSRTPPEDPFYSTVTMRWLRRRLPANAQVVFFSPLCDGYAPEVARRLDAAGHAVTVVSPDPTVDDTPGTRLARAERVRHLRSLRAGGVRAVDWDTDDHLGVALTHADRRWRS
ncbi:DUF58 domain-containing protein [Halomicrococcus gelatinilyticus]|uniref:DUF58 domain-containing protein n=1 Tax=Halomicrococcus gelatinilyticus TaxID=1702103 RepID=UPI002E0EC191